MQFIKENIIIVGLMLNLSGLILNLIGFYLMIKFKKKKKLSILSIKNNALLSKSPIYKHDLVDSESDDLENYNILEICFINNGTEILFMKDFITKPLVIFNNDVKLIKSNVISSNKYTIIQLKKNSNYYLDFNFIEPNDKISITICYNASDVNEGFIRSKIIGGNESNFHFKSKKEIDARHKAYSLAYGTYMIFCILINIVWYLLGYIFFQAAYKVFNFDFVIDSFMKLWIIRFCMTVYGFIGMIISWIIAFKISKGAQIRAHDEQFKKLEDSNI